MSDLADQYRRHQEEDPDRENPDEKFERAPVFERGPFFETQYDNDGNEVRAPLDQV